MWRFSCLMACVVSLILPGLSWGNNNLIAGGGSLQSPSTYEIRNSSGGFVSSGNLATARSNHCAERLSNGTWEMRDANGAFVANGTLWASRSDHCAAELLNNNVLIIGGSNSSGTWEIRSNTGGLISQGTLWATRQDNFTCNRLLDGNVMVIGGTAAATSWEIRNQFGGLVSNGNNLTYPRVCHTSEVQSDTGNVMIVGSGITGSKDNWELRSSAGSPISSGTLDNARSNGHTQM